MVPSFTSQLSFSCGNGRDVIYVAATTSSTSFVWISEGTPRSACIEGENLLAITGRPEEQGVIDSLGCSTTLEIRHDGWIDGCIDGYALAQSCSLLPLFVSAEIYGKRRYLDVPVITKKFAKLDERKKKDS